MKTFASLILFTFSFVKMEAQIPFEVQFWSCAGYPFNHFEDFEDNSFADHFYFDSTQVNNLWQMGAPQKAIFSPPEYGSRAMITDTSSAYPTNNISSFQFQTIVHCAHPDGTMISFFQKYDADQNTDGGTIEVSHDHGLSWINVINDLLFNFSWVSSGLYTANDTILSLGQKPGFTGTSPSSQFVSIAIHTQWVGMSDDTLAFKFTFASDSIHTNKAGWMIDGLEIMGLGEGIEEYKNNGMISVFPNPVVNDLKFSSRNNFGGSFEVCIYNQMGQLCKKIQANEMESIDVSELKAGIYHCTFLNEENYSSKKIIVQK